MRSGARITVLGFGCLASLAAGACSSERGDTEERTHIRVLDSTLTQSWQTMEDTGFIYRLEILSPAGGDTVRNVIPPEPIIVGDTLVVGLLQVSEDSSLPRRQIFRLHLKDHRMETTAIPGDVWQDFQDLLVSPDGKYIAYVGEDTSTTRSSAGTYAIVRDLATRQVVVKGPGGGGCDCDTDLNHARWFPPDSFEIAVAHTRSWLRVSGKASAGRIHIDTLGEEPDWH